MIDTEWQELLPSVAKTPQEEDLCARTIELVKDMKSSAALKSFIPLALRYILQSAAVVDDVNIPTESARLKSHQFCSSCETNRTEEPGKTEEGRFRFQIAKLMIYQMAARTKRWTPIWRSALGICLHECKECYKGYLRAKRHLSKLFPATHEAAQLTVFRDFVQAKEQDIALEALQKCDDQNPISTTQTYVFLEIIGTLAGKGKLGDLYTEMKKSRTTLPIDSLDEMPSGLIAFAMDDDESVRTWAEQQTNVPVMSTEMATEESTVGLLMRIAMEKGRFNALAYSMQMAPSAFTGSALPNTLLGHLSDSVTQTTAILQCFERLLQLKGSNLWEQEDQEYPLVVLSTILDSPHFNKCIADESSSVDLFAWMSPFIASLIPVKAGIDSNSTSGVSLKTFEDGLKRTAHFLFERVQQGHVPTSNRIAASSQCVAVMLQSIPTNTSEESKDFSAQLQQRSIIAILNEVASLHSSSIAHFAFRSKIPNSNDVIEIEAEAYLLAQQLVEAIFYLNCESIAGDILTISERAIKHQRSYAKQKQSHKKILAQAQSKGGNEKEASAEYEKAFEAIFSKATTELQIGGTVCMELWKECYLVCKPARDLDIFIRPLAALAPFVDLQVTTFTIQIKDDHRENKLYLQYREKLKTIVSTVNRRLRAMRNALPGFLLDSADESINRKTVSGIDLPTLCYKSADSILSTVLSAEEDIHKAAQNVIRSAFEDADTRVDCFRSLFQCNVALALKGVNEFLESFVDAASSLVEANNAAKWMIRSFSDIWDVLCSPTDGLLRSGTPYSLVDRPSEAGRVRARLPVIWTLMCKSIAVIFKRTPSWSRILPHSELIAWFRDVTLFAAEAVEGVSLIQNAATIGIEDEEERARINTTIVEDLALPLEEAASWLRMNNLEIVQETRDYFVAGLKCFQGGVSFPQAAKERLLAFIDGQSKVEKVEARTTLLSLAELEDLHVLLVGREGSAVGDLVSTKKKNVNLLLSSDSEKSETRATQDVPDSEPVLVSVKKAQRDDTPEKRLVNGSRPSTSSTGNLKQQRLPFQSIDSATARKQPFSTPPVPAPPPPRFAAAASGSANRYQGASAKPVASAAKQNGSSASSTSSTASRPSGKMAQLRQDFKANHTIYKPINVTSRYNRFTTRELPEARAPEAKRSFNDSAFPPSILGTSTENKQKKSDTSSGESDSSDDDDGKLGLADLTDGKKASPAKMRSKIRSIEAPQRRAVILEDDAIQRARREREEADRKRRLRELPNFNPLHQTILSWPYDAEGNLPPSGFASKGSATSKGGFQPTQLKPTYRNAEAYVESFLPMLLLECWAQMQAAREQVQKKAVEHTPILATVTGRSTIDAFDSLAITSHPARGAQQVFLQETDVIYIRERANGGKQRTVMAKIDAFKMHPQGPRLTVRTCLTKDEQGMSSILVGGAQIEIGKLFSLTTLHREFIALQSVRYYDMLQSILTARSATKEFIRNEEIEAAQRNYSVNKPQAEAILSAISSPQGFQLIQGPPGTGKTKTICSLVGHFLQTRKAPSVPIRAGQQTNGSAVSVKKKIFLCAPSNAAVDEVARRVHMGITTADGKTIKPNVVRVGREEAMNIAVKSISLESIVEKRLSASKDSSSQKDPNSMDPAQLQAELRALKDRLDNKRGEIENARLTGVSDKVIEQMESEKMVMISKRLNLTSKLDEAKDAVQTVNRQQDADRRRIQQDILMQADVVCSTLGGAGHPLLSSLPFDFDTVIIDEAAQAVELDTLIPLRYGCRKCILVGDPNQLPPTVISREAERLRYSQSLFVRLFNNPNNHSNLLSIQYRMHPYISQFPSEAFYDGKLEDGPEMAKLTVKPWHKDHWLRPLRFFDCKRSAEAMGRGGHSLVNRAEAEMACNLYSRLRREAQKSGSSSSSALDGKVGVVTMYKDQVFELKRAFRREYGDGIDEVVDFNTVDGFQGQEKDVIILSCVRSNGIGFLNDFRRINVAITRAKSNLFIIAHVPNLERNDKAGFWKKFIEIARKNEDLIAATSEDLNKPFMVHSSPAKRDSKVQREGIGAGKITSIPASPSGKTKRAEPQNEDDSMEAGPKKKPRLETQSNTSHAQHTPGISGNSNATQPTRPSSQPVRPVNKIALASTPRPLPRPPTGPKADRLAAPPKRPFPLPNKPKGSHPGPPPILPKRPKVSHPGPPPIPPSSRPAGNPIAMPGQAPVLMTPAQMAASRNQRPPQGPRLDPSRRPNGPPAGPSNQPSTTMFLPKPNNRREKRF
ncbi:uncharacterized protein FA14DRAFT_140737 [Meira miltonrushii]|uniref:AAA+ ATPase domain-containing protein n=1 Tax=Meira miltonrushii TaxID=1280837 RepID=A0A316VHR0_9BASI|nr:uncharacterized protein FA14DRAFT_140737 [Meira miltonrushii]PWN36784.1 hypothetical protein FA14DRAFT_140737 [Meira miltonrushii]